MLQVHYFMITVLTKFNILTYFLKCTNVIGNQWLPGRRAHHKMRNGQQ